MILSSAQLALVKAAIVADAAFNGIPNNTDGATVIAAALNLIAVPDFIVWRTDVRPIEVVNAIVGSEFAALTAIKQNLLTLLLLPGVVDASAPNVQTDFSAIFSAGATLTALSTLAKRQATRAEKALATGTGSTGSPATMAAQGQGLITFEQVDLARHS